MKKIIYLAISAILAFYAGQALAADTVKKPDTTPVATDKPCPYAGDRNAKTCAKPAEKVAATEAKKKKKQK